MCVCMYCATLCSALSAVLSSPPSPAADGMAALFDKDEKYLQKRLNSGSRTTDQWLEDD